MPKLLVILFTLLSMPTLSHAGIWETINGPTKLEGVVLYTGSDNAPVNAEGGVQHLVLMVIKKVTLGQVRVDYSLAFSYVASPEQTLRAGDIIKVSFEINEKLPDFSTIEKIGNIYNKYNKFLPTALHRS